MTHVSWYHDLESHSKQLRNMLKYSHILHYLDKDNLNLYKIFLFTEKTSLNPEKEIFHIKLDSHSSLGDFWILHSKVRTKIKDHRISLIN